MHTISSIIDRIRLTAFPVVRGLIRDSRREKPATRNEIPRIAVSTEFLGHLNTSATRKIKTEIASNTHFRI